MTGHCAWHSTCRGEPEHSEVLAALQSSGFRNSISPPPTIGLYSPNPPPSPFCLTSPGPCYPELLPQDYQYFSSPQTTGPADFPAYAPSIPYAPMYHPPESSVIPVPPPQSPAAAFCSPPAPSLPPQHPSQADIVLGQIEAAEAIAPAEANEGTKSPPPLTANVKIEPGTHDRADPKLQTPEAAVDPLNIHTLLPRKSQHKRVGGSLYRALKLAGVDISALNIPRGRPPRRKVGVKGWRRRRTLLDAIKSGLELPRLPGASKRPIVFQVPKRVKKDPKTRKAKTEEVVPARPRSARERIVSTRLRDVTNQPRPMKQRLAHEKTTACESESDNESEDEKEEALILDVLTGLRSAE